MQLPEQLLNELRTLSCFNEAQFCSAHQTPPITSVRKHPIKGADYNINNDGVEWCANGIYLKERPVFTLDPTYQAGGYYVQEASSMFLEQIWKTINPNQETVRVLDLCAAPGGKSTHLVSLMSNESLLISNEVIRPRATVLEENMTRWGYLNNWVTCNDPRDFGFLQGYFDVIVIDAPCSGSGLFRKDEAALDEWSEDNVNLCNSRQKRIIADAWKALKHNGFLVYATCSYSPQEDEDILDWISYTYSAETIPIPIHHSWGISLTTSPLHQNYGYRFFPGSTRGEGFFTGVMQKKDSISAQLLPRVKQSIQVKIKEQTEHFLNINNLCYKAIGGEQFTAIHNSHEADWQLFEKKLYFRKAGTLLGSPTAKEWIPAHDIALSIHLKEDVPHINVDKEQALKFLKRETFLDENMGKGWKVIKFNNLGLGWVKTLENRVNNYLPKHLRIRMELPSDI